MKKTYIQPKTTTDFALCENLVAASKFDAINGNSQKISPFDDDEYNGIFAVKGYTFGDDLDD
ncbi:MAG: hypothetical protein IKO73_03230 [Bacteroidaceae bacterium]|nr:hypothetical protein [Bacteroidaceae bacterium]